MIRYFLPTFTPKYSTVSWTNVKHKRVSYLSPKSRARFFRRKMTVGKSRRRRDVAVWRDHVEGGERRSGKPCPANGPKNCGRRISRRWKN
jgi:hypothetical protein